MLSSNFPPHHCPLSWRRKDELQIPTVVQGFRQFGREKVGMDTAYPEDTHAQLWRIHSSVPSMRDSPSLEQPHGMTIVRDHPVIRVTQREAGERGSEPQTNTAMKRWCLLSVASPSRLGSNLSGVRQGCITSSWFEIKSKIAITVLESGGRGEG